MGMRRDEVEPAQLPALRYGTDLLQEVSIERGCSRMAYITAAMFDACELVSHEKRRPIQRQTGSYLAKEEVEGSQDPKSGRTALQKLKTSIAPEL